MKTLYLRLESRQQTLVIGSLCMLAVLLGLYGFFINSAIRNVVAREKIETEKSELAASLGTLEEQYSQLKSSITPELATARGFAVASDPVFIGAGQKSAGLSLNVR